MSSQGGTYEESEVNAVKCLYDVTLIFVCLIPYWIVHAQVCLDVFCFWILPLIGNQMVIEFLVSQTSIGLSHLIFSELFVFSFELSADRVLCRNTIQ